MMKLQQRNLVLFTAGRLISLIGSAIQMIAIPLYILDLTGSGMMMGFFTVLSMVPLLLISPLAGVLGDRFNRKNIAVYTDFGRGGLVLFLSSLAFAGKMNIVVLFVSQVVISLMDSLFNAATAAMLPDLVSDADLSRANAAKGASDGLSMVIGPALGGVIYGIWGIKMVFFLNAVSFIFSALCEIMIRYQVAVKKAAPLTFKSFHSEVSEIVSFIKRRAGLWQLFLFAMAVNFLANPLMFVVMPYLCRKIIGFQASQLGYLMTFFMAGVLIGNVLIGSLFAKTGNGKLMRLGILAMGLFFALFALLALPNIIVGFAGIKWVYFGIMGAYLAVGGVFNAMLNTPMMTNFQKMVPSRLRSRFFAVLTLIAQLAVPLGAAAFGILLDKVRVHYLMITVGLIMLAGTIWFASAANSEVFEPRSLEEG